MVNKRCPNRYLIIAYDQTTFAELMDMDQRHEWHATFVSDPRVNVVRIHFKEQPGQLRERWRPPRVDPCVESGSPCKPDQIPVISGVIRVVVRQKDVAQRRQWHIGKHKLTGHAVAAVDHIRGVVSDNDLGRRRTRLARPWSTTSPEEDQSRPCRLAFASVWLRERTHQRNSAREKSTSAHAWHG
jgi:hypothetical protein